MMTPSEIHLVKSCAAIYMIENTNDGKVYVGSSVYLRKRLHEHVRRLRLGSSHNKYLQRSWDTHGENAFEITVIEEVSNLDALLEREQAWIDEKKSADSKFGFNFKPAEQGRLGQPHSDETKQKISLALTGKKNSYRHSKETLRRISEAHKGYKFSDESRKKMSKSAMGRVRGPLSAETKSKIGDANRGRKISDQQKAALSVFHTGRITSDETREKLSESARRDWARRKQISQQSVN